MVLIAAGATTVSAVDRQDTRWTELRRHSEPMASAAQDLYSSLSAADATAATAYLSGGLQPERLRRAYDRALAGASAALVTAAVGAPSDDEHTTALLAGIEYDLLRYTRLIAVAEANNRAGNPVGVNYLNTASELMQTQILPRAEQLYHDQADGVRQLLRRSETPAWPALILTALALAALLVFQLHLARRTRRVFNVGLVTATAVTAVLLIWPAIAGGVSQSHARTALTDGAEPQATLTAARILTQQTRTAETIALLRRAPGTEAVADRLDRIDVVIATGALPAGPDTDAREAIERWRSGQSAADALFGDGDHTGAVAVTIGDGPATTETAFVELDTLLAAQIDERADRVRRDADSGVDAMVLLRPAAALLTLIAAVAVGTGLWPRLSEYQ